MASVMNLFRTTVLLSIVKEVTSVASWDTTQKSDNSSTLIKRLTQPVNIVVGENFDNNSRRDFNSNMKFQTHLEVDEITQPMLTNNKKQYHDFLNSNYHPENYFKCPPCICKNISSTSVSVLCVRSSIPSIPQSWPVEMDEIIIDGCEGLEVLDLWNLLIYPSLRHVKIMTYGLFKIISSSQFNVSSSMTYLVLDTNEILTIEESCFSGFPELLNLSLRYNKIENLTKEMFTGLRSLRYLSVAINNINFIADNTFDDMGNLVTLDISQNKIIYTKYDVLPVRIFTPLKNLEQLYINDVCKRDTYQCGSYPNKALQVLTKLRLLCIDGADSRGLGPEIKSLVHLRHLIITYPQSFNVCDESYFYNVPSLTTLMFYFISPKIPPQAFENLPNLVNLTYLSIRGHKDLCKVLRDIKYLLNSSLTNLTLSEVNNRFSGCKALYAQHGVYLNSFNLIELDLSKNYLVLLSPGFMTMLPETLKKIDLSRNCLSNELFDILNFSPKHIMEINLNYQSIDFVKDNNKPLKDKNEFHANKSEISTIIVPTSSFEDHTLDTIKVLNNTLPPKLEILRADEFQNFGKYIGRLFDSQNCSLKTLSVAGSDIHDLKSGHFLSTVEVADLSDNNAENFDKDFFSDNNSLKYLCMSNNLLGYALDDDTENNFFANTKQLIVLDISKNSISEIESDYFKNLFKLQILDISDNKLSMINISFSHMTELRFLNLKSNAIIEISKQSRNDLDKIAAQHQVYIDLTFNLLPCTCEGLELMKWMAFTNVYILSQDFLKCRNEFHQVFELGNIVKRVETLQHQCGSKTVIILACVFTMIGFGILLIASLMYRYRWKLRYLRSIALVKLLGSRPTANNLIGYRFDAYILYTDDTKRFVLRDCVRELEEKRGHRLCIEDRDFLPGIYTVSNIISSVQNSAKTVVMVTPEFYQGEYSEYSVKMALMEEIFMRRSVLFLCVCEPTDATDFSHDLLNAMKENNYIEYPPRDDTTDEIIDEFWNQFSRAIGRNEREII